MVLGKLAVPGRPTIWMIVGQGPIVLAVGAGGGCLDIFTLVYPFSPLSPFLWETARYRLKYCLKGPLNPKQPTNQPTNFLQVFQKRFIFNRRRRNEDIWHVININICISIILFINFTELLFMVVSCAVGGYPASRIFDKTESSQ